MNEYHEISARTSTARRPCLVDGCPCGDARIVSHRRAAFFRVIALANGQTADRRIAPESGWLLPSRPTAR